MTKQKAKATRPEWFTDCMHCLGEVDPTPASTLMRSCPIARVTSPTIPALEQADEGGGERYYAGRHRLRITTRQRLAVHSKIGRSSP